MSLKKHPGYREIKVELLLDIRSIVIYTSGNTSIQLRNEIVSRKNTDYAGATSRKKKSIANNVSEALVDAIAKVTLYGTTHILTSQCTFQKLRVTTEIT